MGRLTVAVREEFELLNTSIRRLNADNEANLTRLREVFNLALNPFTYTTNFQGKLICVCCYQVVEGEKGHAEGCNISKILQLRPYYMDPVWIQEQARVCGLCGCAMGLHGDEEDGVRDCPSQKKVDES